MIKLRNIIELLSILIIIMFLNKKAEMTNNDKFIFILIILFIFIILNSKFAQEGFSLKQLRQLFNIKKKYKEAKRAFKNMKTGCT